MYELFGSLSTQLGTGPGNGHLVFLFTLLFLSFTTAQTTSLLLKSWDKDIRLAPRTGISFLCAIIFAATIYFLAEALMKITIALGPIVYFIAIVWLLVMEHLTWHRLRQEEVRRFNAQTKVPAAPK